MASMTTMATALYPYPYLRLHLLVSAAGEAGSDKPGHRSDRPVGAAMLRRVLGKVLIDQHCIFQEPRCEARPPAGSSPMAPAELCCQARSCPYGVLYAASRTPRPPYALYLPPARDAGIDLIEVTLLADGWRFYPWLIGGLRQALQLGLGRRRQSFQVNEVLRVQPDRSRERLCGSGVSTLPATMAPDSLGLSLEPLAAGAPIDVMLLSPLRLLHEGRLVRGTAGSEAAAIPFKLLIARILDRFHGIFPPQATTAGPAFSPEAREILERAAAEVRLLHHDVDWLEVPDYSARSDREMTLGGWVGRLTYGPEARTFLPVLRAGEILHVGKNPVSGCGRIRVGEARSG